MTNYKKIIVKIDYSLQNRKGTSSTKYDISSVLTDNERNIIIYLPVELYSEDGKTIKKESIIPMFSISRSLFNKVCE